MITFGFPLKQPKFDEQALRGFDVKRHQLRASWRTSCIRLPRLGKIFVSSSRLSKHTSVSSSPWWTGLSARSLASRSW